MSPEDGKALIRRYIEAVDANRTSDWSVLDEFIAEDFVAHNPRDILRKLPPRTIDLVGDARLPAAGDHV